MKNLALSAVVAAALWGCGGPGGNDGGSGGGSGGSGGAGGGAACAEPTNPNYVCDGGTTVTTATLWTAVISPDCVSTCHKPGGNAISYGDYSSASTFQTSEVGVKSLYAASAQTLKRVDPNNPQNSAVWLKVLGGGTGHKGPKCENVGNPMPDGLAALSPAKLDQIKNWICSGATP